MPLSCGIIDGLQPNAPYGGPGFRFEVDNLTGTPANGTPGTNFTFGGSNADSAAVSVLSALAQDIQYIIIQVTGCATTAEDNNALVDILVDPLGGTSWTVKIADLVAGFSPVPTNSGLSLGVVYHFPLEIRAGASLGIQARKAGATAAIGGRVTIHCMGQPTRHSQFWCGTAIESLGINAASSKGTNITAGTSGAAGTWTTIGTSTKRYGAIQFGVNGSDDTASALGYYWQVGYNSTKLPGSPIIYTASNTSETMQRSGPNCLIRCDVPTSTAWQMSGTCSGTSEVYNAAVYGVY